VRLDAGGKVLTSYAIPHEPEGNPGLVEDFRVCEKSEAFYLLAREAARSAAFGFDGRVRDPRSVVIRFHALSPHVQLLHPSAVLVDGKLDPPPSPWLAWGDVGNFAGTRSHTGRPLSEANRHHSVAVDDGNAS
jgi:hypothetical protein